MQVAPELAFGQESTKLIKEPSKMTNRMAILVLVGLCTVSTVAAWDNPRPTKPKELDQQIEKDAEDRISKALGECIDRDSTTAGMLRCAEVEFLQRKHELEETYDKLDAQLPKRLGDNAHNEFRNSHKRWEKYRDAQFKLIDRIYSKAQGTLYIPMRVSVRSEVVHARTQELKRLLFMLENVTFWGEKQKDDE